MALIDLGEHDGAKFFSMALSGSLIADDVLSDDPDSEYATAVALEGLAGSDVCSNAQKSLIWYNFGERRG